MVHSYDSHPPESSDWLPGGFFGCFSGATTPGAQNSLSATVTIKIKILKTGTCYASRVHSCKTWGFAALQSSFALKVLIFDLSFTSLTCWHMRIYLPTHLATWSDTPTKYIDSECSQLVGVANSGLTQAAIVWAKRAHQCCRQTPNCK